MKNLQKHAISFFLGFVWVGAQSQKQLRKNPIVVGRGSNRRLNRAIRFVMGYVVEGALNFAKNEGGMLRRKLSRKQLKALKSLAVMGGESQQDGARRGEGESLAGTELRESRRAHHPSHQP